MFTEPVFLGDVDRLRGAVATERRRKIDVLRRIGMLCPVCGGDGADRTQAISPDLVLPCKKCAGTGVDKKIVGSNDKLAALLREYGVEPPVKTSPTTGEQIYAFAKTDPGMQDLLEDEDEEVRCIAEARIAVKSNIVETRAARYQQCAERGAMPSTCPMEPRTHFAWAAATR
ncbi:MAG: hypothetical protein IPM06_21285 [Rhizobiales bacterium]|nr:hypothetical protein [Hyphomicrobiales bacterium]